MEREVELRLKGAAGQPPDLRRMRAHVLDELRAYRRRGVFPANPHPRERAVCFIDPGGRRCAVAALMEATGEVDRAQSVARSHDLARIAAMPRDGLGDWARGVGLTVEEVARIQPTYSPDLAGWERFHDGFTFLVSAGLAGVVSILLNMWSVMKGVGRSRLGVALAGVCAP